jgi:hypothetical protein
MMGHMRRSIRPFGYRGKMFERRRDAEAYVEEMQQAGHDAWWVTWGKGFKVYVEKVSRGIRPASD